MNSYLKSSLLEFIRRTSCEMPKDISDAIFAATKREVEGSRGRYAMDIVCENIKLAAKRSQPICQDTGSILFFVRTPVGFNQIEFEDAARKAVAEATEKGFLRQNSVDSITGKNSGNNLGPGSPCFHFEQISPSPTPSPTLPHQGGGKMMVKLLLKGGGCENCGAQYSLPDKKLDAQRNLDGVRKCVLDCVLQAQGKGCGPAILGVCFGGDRVTGYIHSKEQLLRPLTDTNPIPELAKMEKEIMEISNKLGIGPMGFGGATTLLGCKIIAQNRIPASFFVSISYMCWADRRQGVELDNDGKIVRWIY